MFGIGNPELGVIMLGLFVVFIMFGFPIAFTLMALGVFFGYFAMGDLVFNLLVQRTYSVMTNDVLISIPLFVFMGYIIERANILDRLFRSLQLAAGPVPGRWRSRPSRPARSLRPRPASSAPASR
jgi:TRAP-type mannitol/chloroaromatic compound transport system permease large subunit